MFERALKELNRSRAVDQLGMLRTGAEPLFDRLVTHIARAFDAPIALLTIADCNRLWFKSAVGTTLSGIARHESFCKHVFDRDGPLEVCNAAEEDEFRDMSIVTGETNIRYYLGTPIRLSNGIAVGSLCVLDQVERSAASRDQRAFLQAMARQAEMAIEYARYGPASPVS